MDLSVTVVIPAAGSGERMNTSVPKQFCEIRGKTIISHTMDAFLRIPWIQHVIVTTSLDHQHVLNNQYKGHERVKVTLGSSTRHRSIHNGVKVISEVQASCDIVVIHDGVRPLIEEELLKEVVLAAHEHGAAGVVRPLVSTVISIDDEGFLDESLPRSQYRASEMPQAFRYQIISAAYKQCSDYDLDYGTECLHLAQKYAGSKVRLLDGPEYLWKLTYRKDLYAFEGVLKESDCCFIHLVNFEEGVEFLRDIIDQSLTQTTSQFTEVLTSEVSTVIIHLSPVHSSDVWMAECAEVLCHTSVQCIICIQTVLNREVWKQQCSDFMEFVKRLETSQDGEGKLVYGIAFQGSESMKVVQILRFLVQDRTPVLSGQTFIVH